MNISEASLVKITIILAVSAILIGVISFYLTMWILKVRILGKGNKAFNGNLFFPILVLGSLIGIGTIVSGIIPSISSTLKIISQTNPANLFSEALAYISICSILIFTGVVVINYLCAFLFQSLFSKVNIKDELEAGKLAYPIIFSGLFIGLSIALKDVFVVISELFIPFNN